MEVEVTNPYADYRLGDQVRVVDGPFASFAGVIVREAGATSDEVLVEVTMFGRPVPIHAEPSQLQRRPARV
jgi:transcription termination/antitermination protein NusG